MKTWLHETFCRLFHGRPMHPVNGLYRCPRCLTSKPRPDGPRVRFKVQGA